MAVSNVAPRLGRHQMTPNITELCSIYVDRPPSCMDFSPRVGKYLIIGTYELQEDQSGSLSERPSEDDAQITGLPSDCKTKPQKRAGSLLLYEVVEKQLMRVQEIATTAAVWDIQFCPSQPQYFATSLSVGKIELYHLEETRTEGRITCSMKRLLSHQVCNVDTAVTFLAWHPSDPSILGCTLSNGEVLRLDLSTITGPDGSQEPSFKSYLINQHVLKLRHSLPSKELAWCCTWDSESDALYSGGEDAALRVSTDAAKPPSEMDALMNNVVTGFGAGVTCIVLCQILGQEDALAIVGSQDEYVRIYNVRDLGVTAPPTPGPRNPIAMLRLKGPIYRLKVVGNSGSRNSTTPRTLWVLVSCQQSGIMWLKIVLGDESNTRPEMSITISVVGWVDTFDREHQLCYSIAKPVSQTSSLELVGNSRLWGHVSFVTSSFYERIVRLCVFDAEMDDSMRGLKRQVSPSRRSEVEQELQSLGDVSKVPPAPSSSCQTADASTPTLAGSLSEHHRGSAAQGSAATDRIAADPAMIPNARNPNANSAPKAYRMASGQYLDSASAYLHVPTSSVGLHPSAIRANSTWRDFSLTGNSSNVPNALMGPFDAMKTMAPCLPGTRPTTASASSTEGLLYLDPSDSTLSSARAPRAHAVGTVGLLDNLHLTDGGADTEHSSMLENPQPDLTSMTEHGQLSDFDIAAWTPDAIVNQSLNPSPPDYLRMLEGADPIPTLEDDTVVPLSFTDLLASQSLVSTTSPEQTSSVSVVGSAGMEDGGVAAMAVRDVMEELKKNMNEPEIIECGMEPPYEHF